MTCRSQVAPNSAIHRVLLLQAADVCDKVRVVELRSASVMIPILVPLQRVYAERSRSPWASECLFLSVVLVQFPPVAGDVALDEGVWALAGVFQLTERSLCGHDSSEREPSSPLQESRELSGSPEAAESAQAV